MTNSVLSVHPQPVLADREHGTLEELPASVPEHSYGERRVMLLLLFISFAYLCLFRRFTAIDPDEGIILQGAQRILRGEVLYRDFFSFITPGSYYLLALLFRVFGSSIVVARIALVFHGKHIVRVVTYLLARRVCSRTTALLNRGANDHDVPALSVSGSA